MDQRVFDPLTLFVILGGMTVIFLGLLFRHIESLQKNIPLWLWSGLAGLLIGGGATGFAMHTLSKESELHISFLESQLQRLSSGQARGDDMARGGTGGGGMGTGMGGGGGMGGGRGTGGGMGGGNGMGGGRGTGGGMGGGNGMGGGMGGGNGTGGGSGGNAAGAGGGPRARRDLTSLVGKLGLLTRGLQIKLETDQLKDLARAVGELDAAEEMTEDQAQIHLDQIKAILTADQRTQLDSIELPRRPGSGLGGSAVPTPVPAAPVSTGQGTRGGVGPGREGRAAVGNPQPTDENPFKVEENAKRLEELRDRLGLSPAAGDKNANE